MPDSIKFSGSPEERLSNWLEENLGAGDILCQYYHIPAIKSSKFPRIYPFLIRLETNQPDICIEFGKKSPKYPGLIIEVVSNDNLKNTVANCVASMIDQFRYLRLFFGMPCICGYVFPSDKSRSCVVKIIIEWKKIKFIVSFKRLERSDVLNDIRKVQCIEENLVPVEKNIQDLYFMKLSQDDINEIQLDFNIQDELEQVPSGNNIILRDNNFYYKILPIGIRRETLMSLALSVFYLKQSNSNVYMNNYVFPYLILNFPNYSADIFQFQKQAFAPLSKTDAKKCLVDLVDQIIPVLSNFHQNFNYAHNDVRLPNICFDDNGIVRLIDFDFAHKSWEIANYSDSDPFLNNPPTNQLLNPPNDVNRTWTHAELDFKQLGLMIFCILQPEFSQTTVEEKDVLVRLPSIYKVHRDFLSDLVVIASFKLGRSRMTIATFLPSKALLKSEKKGMRRQNLKLLQNENCLVTFAFLSNYLNYNFLSLFKLKTNHNGEFHVKSTSHFTTII